MSPKQIKLEDFNINISLSMPKRIASFLDWAAKVAPGRPVSYQLLTKVCAKTGRLPTENDSRVTVVRNAVHRAKSVLMDEYGRGVVSHPGMGIRATIDSEDTARTQMENDARRITSAIRAADRTRSIINVKDIRDKELRNRVTNVNSALKVLISQDVMTRLLPEKKEE